MGAVFIICSKTNDYYSFIGNMRSKVRGSGRSTERRSKVCDSELIFILSSLCTNAPKPSWFWSGSDRIDAKSTLRHICCLKFCLDFLWRLMNFKQVVGPPSCIFHINVPDKIRKKSTEYMEVQILDSLSVRMRQQPEGVDHLRCSPTKTLN